MLNTKCKNIGINLIAKLLLTLLSFLIFTSQATFAQISSSISVIPSIIRLDLSQDKPETSLIYQNNTQETIELRFSAQDFTELEEGWKVNFLNEKDAKNYHYSLSSWISFEKKSLILHPLEKGELKILIDKEKLTPGGHYASILAEVKNSNSLKKGDVAVKGILSSLLFVRTSTGQELEKGEISSFDPIQSWFSFPKTFSLKFKNSGNTDLTPYGVVEIKDPFGNLTIKAVLNEDSHVTLPETIRKYDILLKPGQTFMLPGFYQANLQIHFGKQNQTLTAEDKFFTLGNIPLLSIPTTLLVMLAIFLTIRNVRKKRV